LSPVFGGDDSRTVLLSILAGGVAYLAIDVLGRAFLSPAEERPRARFAWPVYVALLCAAALLGMAYRLGPLTIAIAALPLFLTRFAFERLDLAHRTYHQTIQALSIVPELAGHALLGHGERTAIYAQAIGDELGLTPEQHERVATAARLHHIGYVSLGGDDEPTHPAAVGRVSASILRETGFLADVAELVEAVSDPTHDAGRPPTVEAAVVRVSRAFDDLVGNDPDRADGALALVASRQRDDVTASVVSALQDLCRSRPELVDEAVSATAPLTAAAAVAAEEYGRRS
jgi:hypothetical protein